MKDRPCTELNLSISGLIILKTLHSCKYTSLSIQLHNHTAKPQRKIYLFILTNAKSETNQITQKGQTVKNRFHYWTKRWDHSGNWKHGLLPQDTQKVFLYYINFPHPLFITDAKLDSFYARWLLGKWQHSVVPSRGQGAQGLAGLVWEGCAGDEGPHQPPPPSSHRWLSRVSGLWGTAPQISCLQEQGRVLLLLERQALPFRALILAYPYKKQLLVGF